jgi:RNA-binding protein
LAKLNPKSLSTSQRRWLKSKAHTLRPTVWVGEDGIVAGTVGAVMDALATHELIKVRLRRPESKADIADSVAQSAFAHLVDVVGHTVILYREREEDPALILPK